MNEAKKSYSTPTVEQLGAVRELTLGSGNNNNNDNNNGQHGQHGNH